MSEVFMNWKRGHFQYWLEALEAKYKGKGKPYGPKDFQKLYAGYIVRRLTHPLYYLM